MRQILMLHLFACSVVISKPSATLAADNSEQLGKKIDNSQIMDRVALVGVIADGSSATGGVAVIKDSKTGKTYAIRTGDNLPGVTHIKLKSVQREVAVFKVEGKEYHVRLAIGAIPRETEDEDHLLVDFDKPDGPGLFEQWNESQGSKHSFTITDLSSDNESIHDSNPSKLNGEPIVIKANSANPIDGTIGIRRGNEVQISEFIDKMSGTSKIIKDASDEVDNSELGTTGNLQQIPLNLD